jgi:hypothetical protein
MYRINQPGRVDFDGKSGAEVGVLAVELNNCIGPTEFMRCLDCRNVNVDFSVDRRVGITELPVERDFDASDSVFVSFCFASAI